MKDMILISLLAIIMEGCSSMLERVDESTGEKIFSGNGHTSIWKSPFIEINLTYKPTARRFRISVIFYTVSTKVIKFDMKTIELTNKKKTLVLQNQNEVCYTQKFKRSTGCVSHTSTVEIPLADKQFVELEEIIMSPKSLIKITNEYGNQFSNKITDKGGIVKLFKCIK